MKELTVVGLPYYGFEKVKSKLLEGASPLTLHHDAENAHSKHAIEVRYLGTKIGYITGRESPQVFQALQKAEIATSATLLEIRESCLKLKTYSTKIDSNPFDEHIPTDLDNAISYAVNSLASKNISIGALNLNLNKKEEPTMMEKIVNTNTKLAQSAAFLEAGRIANNTATKFVSSKAPLMVKGYVDTAFGKLLIANAAAMAVEKFRGTDTRLVKLTNAMITQAYQEVYQSFDVEKMINELFASETLKAALSKIDDSES